MKYAVACLLGVAQATILDIESIESEKAFLDHLNDWGKSFGTVEEFEFRKAIFKEKHNFMLEWNNDPNQTHKLTTDNQFATWTDEEYKRLLGFSQ
jgi:hypothetical protein